MFFTSPSVADYVWAARKNLRHAEREAFAQALLNLQPGKDDAILRILRGTKFVRARHDAYSKMASTDRELGLL